ncbi:ABC transporter permease [Amycolatopsis pithecellobii]|uniref:ABC transporter permease n=1 Tax=Amycolatopsis pithecellobii TaxID=664692 RepID=A0A6N7Z392_9PSEU|nr:ABC transporter permease [Amycolatopsis pithecellobii]MTD55539.1 ABC transporter permease [Amycolatopsis pithecellobii]
MSVDNETDVVSAGVDTGSPKRPARHDSRPARTRILAILQMEKYSALWIWAGLIILFGLWVPDTFLTWSNVQIILSSQAVTAIVALGLVAPLAVGAVDLAVGSVVGFAGMLAAVLMARGDWGTVPTIVVTLALGCGIGAAMGVLVGVVRISSMIVTLAASSVLSGMIFWLSESQNVVGLTSQFLALGSGTALGLAWPFWVMLLLCIGAWLFLDHTATGRYLHATGLGQEAAKLSGVPTTRLIVLALTLSAGAASIAGLLGTARIGAGDPSFGPSYLLPAYAAVFLGSTQVRPGFFNPWGTVISVYVLATGVKGLQLAGAPVWIPEVFNGLALLAAVSLAVVRQRMAAHRTLVRMRRLVNARRPR